MTSDLIQLTADPIRSELIDAVQSPSAGGTCVFLGTTRGEKRGDGVELLALDYEAYEAMAVDQMRDLARRARERWPVEKIAIIHRIGRVEVGLPSVLVAVSTPHRSEAFAACQWLIDTLKADVTIWKKEIWADGDASWVQPK